MAFSTDSGGIAFKCNDVKLQGQASLWATKLSQLGRQNGTVRIITYSLPDLGYIKEQFQRRPKNVFIICHERFIERAGEIKRFFPSIRVAVNPAVHSKILLIEPHTVYVSSANFGLSRWHETSVGFHSKEAHDWYADHEFKPLWIRSEEVA